MKGSPATMRPLFQSAQNQADELLKKAHSCYLYCV